MAQEPANTLSTTDWQQAIEAVRTKIDAIDDQIAALLKQRLEQVKAIGALKHTHAPDQFVIRSGREAKMLRRMVNQFQGSAFHPLAVATIWRQIIAASANTESPLKLSVYAPSEHTPLALFAREYFGAFCPVQRQPTAKRVIGDVVDGKANIGILPLPQNDEPDPWWPLLAAQGEAAPHIFARLPFVNIASPRDSLGAFAIANITPETSGNDVSYIALKTDMEISQSRLNSLFSKHRLSARWVAVYASSADRQYLVELDGLIEKQNTSLNAMLGEAGASILSHSILGACATPITLTDSYDKTRTEKP